MTASVTQVFDKVGEYLKKNYENLENYTMPYCSLYEDTIKKKRYYRANINFKLKDDSYSRIACIKASVETGDIEYFIAGKHWTYAV